MALSPLSGSSSHAKVSPRTHTRVSLTSWPLMPCLAEIFSAVARLILRVATHEVSTIGSLRTACQVALDSEGRSDWPTASRVCVEFGRFAAPQGRPGGLRSAHRSGGQPWRRCDMRLERGIH